MAVDIKTREYSQVTPSGVKIFYSVQVTDAAGVKSSVNTPDFKKAASFYNASIKKYPAATVNGGPAAASAFGKAAAPAPGTVPSTADLAPGPKVSNTEEVKKLSRTGHGSGDRPKRITAPMKKKAVDLSGLPVEQIKLWERSTPQERIDRKLAGPFCGKQLEAVPNRLTAAGEKIIGQAPSSPAFIVCGRDRPRSTATGYGGKGHTQASCIDLVAGLGGYKPKQVDTDGTKVFTDPDFFKDSARVYISQKSDVDENFAIGKKETYFKSEAKSCVAVKADHVRIIGRESLTLVTNTDRLNSQGGEVRQWSGIELMANNDEEGLQPIPRGDNLRAALMMLSDYLEKFSKVFQGYVTYQSKYNRALMMHTHRSPFYAQPTLPSQAAVQGNMTADIEVLYKTELSILKTLTNLAGFRHNFLTPSGKSFINSRYNKVN